jgi:hypothetical protein
MGFKFTSEDSSEVTFLLVENYNYDRSSWSSDRLGIFESPLLLSVFSLISVACREVEEERYRYGWPSLASPRTPRLVALSQPRIFGAPSCACLGFRPDYTSLVPVATARCTSPLHTPRPPQPHCRIRARNRNCTRHCAVAALSRVLVPERATRDTASLFRPRCRFGGSISGDLGPRNAHVR